MGDAAPTPGDGLPFSDATPGGAPPQAASPEAVAARAASPDGDNAGDPLETIWAMVDAASPEALYEVARVLHAHLHAPEDAATRRIAELGFLAEQLELQSSFESDALDSDALKSDERTHNLPSVLQEVYELERRFAGVDAPSAEVLAWRYGSWRRACYAAYGLRADGSKRAPGTPWLTAIPDDSKGKPYTEEECIRSVRACAAEIGRIPSSSAYSEWYLNTRARARARGQQVRIASNRRILAVLGPERGRRDGWKIVRRRVFGDARSC